MINKTTTFIIGAGASIPYGFPSGERLSTNILGHINLILNYIKGSRGGETVLPELIDDRNYNKDFIIEFSESFIHSGHKSIDAFLEHRPEFVDFGKILIAYDILLQEQRHNLFSPTIAENWYQYLWQQMSIGIRKEDFPKNNLRIVTFNYDRTFEHFFHTVLQKNYKLDLPQAYSLMMSSIGIAHVHGLLGPLYDEKGRSFMSYGVKNLTKHYLSTSAKNIHIISEDLSSPEYSLAEKFMNESDVIYITGFGYHPTNVRRLGLKKLLEVGKQVTMNTYGKTVSELMRVFGDQTDKVLANNKEKTNLQFLREIELL